MKKSISYKSPDPLTLVELHSYLSSLLATEDPDSAVRVSTYLLGTNSDGALIKRITVVSHDDA